MSCLNFIIIKVNGIDVSNLPHDEAIQIFSKAEEPILVEVRRRNVADVNKVCFFNDEFSICTSTCDQNNVNTDKNLSIHRKNVIEETSFPSDKPVIVSTSVSTCLSSSPRHAFYNRSHPQNKCSNHHHENLQMAGQFCGSISSEIDIEEITLRKSRSDEKLGFTVSYSSENSSAIDSDEYIDTDDNHDNDDDDDEDEDTCADIYISDILPDSLAARDGRLRQGDQILQINGRDVSNKDETESLFAENKNAVTLLVSRCIYTDDEFLDSAVYCDDKECQNLSNNQSSSCECEQTSFSSKSSIYNSEPAKSHPITLYQVPPIAAIDTSVCNHLYHFNIKAQLESVNKEINLLNTQISSMKLQKSRALTNELSTKTSVTTTDSTKQNLVLRNSPTAVIKNKNIETVKKNFQKNHERVPLRLPSTPVTVIESEVEHIYETIQEDSESDSYYSSPYETRLERNRVEQWLKSQDDSVSKNISNIDRSDNGTLKNTEPYSNQKVLNPISKTNSSGDDYENSSSAYNTGGSCNSNPVFQLKADDKNQSSSTLVFRPYSRQDEFVNECKHCQIRNRIITKEKLSPKCIKGQETSGRNEEVKNRSQLTETKACNIGTFYTNVKNEHLQHKLFRKSVIKQNISEIASTRSIVTTTSNLVTTSNTITTTTATILPEASYSLNYNKEQSTEPILEQYQDLKKQEKSEMVWKVKRRIDGSRYIVRRPIKNQQLLEDRARKINEERCSQTTEDETLSEVKAGRYWTKDERKRHVGKSKERRQRQPIMTMSKKRRQQQQQQQQQKQWLV